MSDWIYISYNQSLGRGVTFEVIDTFNPETPFLLNSVCWDAKNGTGATGNTGNINYRGFVIFISPATFLKAAARLFDVRDSKSFFDTKLTSEQWCFSPPSLTLTLTSFAGRSFYQVVAHEGRHRATAAKGLGVAQIPVFVQLDNIRAKDITKKMLGDVLNREVRTEEGDRNISLASTIVILDQKVIARTKDVILIWKQVKPKTLMTEAKTAPVPGHDGHTYYWSEVKSNPMVIQNNPPWVVKVLKDIWPILLRRVTDPDLLPKHGPSTGEEGKNLGCGHYGCVMPTNIPGMVCKITTDITEAKFVQAALTLYRDDSDVWPAGMIRYFGVYQIPGKKFRNRPIYVIWRAEAPKNSSLGYHGGSNVLNPLDARLIYQVKDISAEIRKKVTSKKEIRPQTVSKMFRLLPTMLAGYYDLDGIWSTDWSMDTSRGALGAAQKYKILENLLMEMGNRHQTHYIGEALDYYLHEGILLADVHLDNIRMATPEGFSKEVNIISDPGHAVFLDPRWADIRIPTL